MKKIISIATVVIFIFATVLSIMSQQKSYTLFAFDTVVNIKTQDIFGRNYKNEVTAEIDRIQKSLDIFNAASSISRLNRGDRFIDIRLNSLIERTLGYSAQTDWVFDITIKPIKDLWNIGTDKARVPTQSEIDNALKSVGAQKIKTGNKIELNKTQIDLGGVAKGYAGDEIRKLLIKKGLKNFIIDLGGNIVIHGKEYSVGIKNPNDSAKMIVLRLKDTNIVTSGTYERYFTYDGVTYHHIFDPKTGYPVKSDLVSATIVDTSGERADIFATTSILWGKEKSITKFREMGIEYVLQTTDGEIIISDGLKDKVVQ